MLDVSVNGEEYIKVRLDKRKKDAVFLLGPSHLLRGSYLMLWHESP